MWNAFQQFALFSPLPFWWRKGQNCIFSILFVCQLHSLICPNFSFQLNSLIRIFYDCYLWWPQPLRPLCAFSSLSICSLNQFSRNQLISILNMTGQMCVYVAKSFSMLPNDSSHTCWSRHANRIALEVWFSLEKYFLGEAVLLVGVCGLSVCVFECQLVPCWEFSALWILEWKRKSKVKVGEDVESERRVNSAQWWEKGDQRWWRWRTPLDDITVTEGEMKILREETKGQKVKGDSLRRNLQQDTERRKGG